MKAKWIGLLLLIVVALGAVGYVWFSQTTQVTEITGYVGGEKIGLLEDEQVQKILKDKYRLSLDYNRAGSIEMVTTLDRVGQDFLFPSNQTALELFEGEEGSPEKSQIVFNTPIVLYTHAAVAEALTSEGVFSQSGGVLTADMEQLVELMESGAQWSDVGLPELYGSVTVGTTDQRPLRRLRGGGGPAGIAAPAPGIVPEAGVHGELLLGLVRPVFENRHGGKASYCRVREPTIGIRRAGAGDLGADQRGHCNGLSHPHGVVLPCVHRLGRGRDPGD